MKLFRNAHVFAPEDLGVQDVLFADTILAMGRLDPRLDVEIVDLEGRMLVPGLIDAHTHLSGGGGEGGARTRVPAVALSALTLAGVTTAIGLLGTDCQTRSIGELLAAARGLEELGITTYCYTGGYEVPPLTLTGSARGDIVHVDRIIAIGETAISDHRSSQPTFEELVRLASDAHVAGMMTGKAGLVHLHLGDGPRGLELVRRALRETELPARTFHPTHVNRSRRLWQEAMALPGPVDISAFDGEHDAPSGGAALAEWVHAGLDPSRVTLSSDSGGCLPSFDGEGRLLSMEVGSSAALMVAIREAVDLGVGLSQALAACTANVASLFRLHRKGRIRVGGDADLVVIEDRMVQDVVARGVWMVRAGAAVVRGPFEGAPAR